MTTISELNYDCLIEVFRWLTLPEKCGVQRVSRAWRRAVDDIVRGEERLELFMEDQTPFGKPSGYPNAYYSPELEDFFRTGVLNESVETFFQKLAGKEQFETLDNIKYLTIAKSANLNSFQNITLSKTVFGQLLAIFPNLKSLNLLNLDIEGANWKILSKFAERLEAFSYDSNESDYELFSFAEGCGQLNALEVPDYLHQSELENFRHLKEINSSVSDTQGLQNILAGNPNLVKITVSVIPNDPREPHHSFENFWELFPFFGRLAALQEVDIRYAGVASGHGSLRLTSDILWQIKRLTLYRVSVTSDDMKVIVRQFVSLTSLSLINFNVTFLEAERVCFVGVAENDAAVEAFLAAILTLEKLKSLCLEYDVPSPADEEYSAAERHKNTKRWPRQVLPSFLDAAKLPELRRLACNCFDIDDCFEAFCEFASESPRQSYAFKEFDSYHPPMKLSEAVRGRQPRNVFFF